MKQKLTPLDVQPDETGRPSLVWYRSRPREVARTLDTWQHAGRWWRGEAERHYYLVRLVSGEVLELYQEGGAWTLSGIHD